MKTQIVKITRVVFAGFFLLATQNLSVAQESKKGHSHAKAEMHNGSVAMSKHHHFEVVFAHDAIQVYLYDEVQNPLSAEGIEGKVTLKFKKGEPKTLALKYASMHHKMDEEGEHMHGEEQAETREHDVMMMDYLTVEVDLSKIEPGTMKAVFFLKGLQNKKETEATFTQTFNGLAQEIEQADEHHHSEHKH